MVFGFLLAGWTIEGFALDAAREQLIREINKQQANDSFPLSQPSPDYSTLLSESFLPFDPPPPPFMPGSPVSGVFDLSPWEFDYMLALAWIGHQLHAWFCQRDISATELTAALEVVSITSRCYGNDLSGKDCHGKDYREFPPMQPRIDVFYPVFVFRQLRPDSLEVDPNVEYIGETCSICLDRYNATDHVIQAPCGHLFHIACLDRNLGERLACPYCRNSNLQFGFCFTHTYTATDVQTRDSVAAHVDFHEFQALIGQIGTSICFVNNEAGIYKRLKHFLQSSSPLIKAQAKVLQQWIYIYSIKAFLEQMQANILIWPNNDTWVYIQLGVLLTSSDPAVMAETKKLHRQFYIAFIESLLKRVQTETSTWPRYDDCVHTQLEYLLNSNDPETITKAQELQRLVDQYSSRNQ